jgi:hypothetical protein
MERDAMDGISLDKGRSAQALRRDWVLGDAELAAVEGTDRTGLRMAAAEAARREAARADGKVDGDSIFRLQTNLIVVPPAVEVTAKSLFE